MKPRDVILGVALAGGLIGLSLAQDGQALTPSSPDPFLWLADIHGPKPLAWVKAQDARTMALLKSDPEYRKDYDTMLAVLNANDRIPMGEVERGSVLNFWQDAAHVRGLWRRTSAEDYARPAPQWNVLLDLDALDAREHKDWVWEGSACVGAMKRCLLRLSPGGSDASVVREFDPASKSFPADGFTLPVAKSDAAWVDENTILFGTDFGPGSMTQSSYPRIVKLWRRGTPLSDAKTVFEGKASDVSVRPVVFRGPYGTVPLIDHGLTFFTSEFYFVQPDGTALKLPLPLGANIKGVSGGALLFTLRDAWTTPGGKQIAQGALVAINVLAFAKNNEAPRYDVLYTPGARATVEDVAPGRDAVYAAIFENVTGAIHEFRAGKSSAWTDTALDLPKGGSTHIMDADAWTPQAYFTFESFL
jgi:prolyl oligopeptidase